MIDELQTLAVAEPPRFASGRAITFKLVGAEYILGHPVTINKEVICRSAGSSTEVS
jgi:hypothetical protein